MMSRRVHALILLLLAGTAAAAQEWVEVKSPHFAVATDGGEKRGREVAERFEQMRAAFGVIFKKNNVNFPVPLQIVAFRRTRELYDVGPIWNGKPVAVSGFFQPGQDRHFIAVDLSSDNWGVVFHEYAHLLINSNLPPMPAWYDEGFAEYFSTLTVSNKKIEVGRISSGRALDMARGDWMPVEALFSVTRNSRDYNERNRAPVFYAESTAVVNYLMRDLKSQREMYAYIELTQQQHVPVAQAIKQAFGMEVKDFDRTLHDVARSGHYSFYSFPAPPGFAAGPFQSRVMEEVEWQTILADLRFHTPDHRDQGVAEFRRILEKAPENTLANRGVGYAFLMQGDFDAAAKHFRLAARDSQDPQIHYLNALLATRRGFDSLTRLSAQELAAARDELKTALRLDPNLADAYNLMAFVDANSDNLEAGIADLHTALEMDPRNDTYRANLARYLTAARKWDDAEKTWTSLLNSSDKAIGQEAASSILQITEAKIAGARQHQDAPPVEAGPVSASGPPAQADAETQPAEEETPAAGQNPIRYVKGRLVGIDCSREPEAVITLRAGNKDLVMFTRNAKRLLLIGEDTFSCSWKNREVSVNYRPQADGRGELVSLELY